MIAILWNKVTLRQTWESGFCGNDILYPSTTVRESRWSVETWRILLQKVYYFIKKEIFNIIYYKYSIMKSSYF